MKSVELSLIRSIGLNLRRSGTDQRHGVNFDHQGGSALGGWTRCNETGAHTDRARHTAKRGETLTAIRRWCAAGWRGRADQVLEFAEPGAADGTTANSLAADRRGPQQDGQTGRSKPPARSRLRILVQGLGPSRARC